MATVVRDHYCIQWGTFKKGAATAVVSTVLVGTVGYYCSNAFLSFASYFLFDITIFTVGSVCEVSPHALMHPFRVIFSLLHYYSAILTCPSFQHSSSTPPPLFCWLTPQPHTVNISHHPPDASCSHGVEVVSSLRCNVCTCVWGHMTYFV